MFPGYVQFFNIISITGYFTAHDFLLIIVQIHLSQGILYKK